MRVGVVGVGRIGSAHAEVLSRHPDVIELVLSDQQPERASAVAEQLGCRSVDPAHHRFLPEVDALVVATATDTHAALITAGVRAGVPVFCEKPVAHDLSGTLQVLEEVSRAEGLVQIGLQRRFDAGYRAARNALRAGDLGDLHRVHMVTADPAPPPAEYVKGSGGIFRDCHIHDFDILRWVTGKEAVTVFATGANRGARFFRDAGDVDNAAAVLQLDDGSLATLQGSRYNGAGYDVRMELAGSRATYAVGISGRTPLTSAEEGVSFPEDSPWPSFWERFTPAYVAEMNAFIDLVRDGGSSPCTVEDALAALYVAEAADRSRIEGRPVEIAEVVK
jgi:myo-inositol 2-dehydrogenase/D-chiro-inositol 1-dehydrogenase